LYWSACIGVLKYSYNNNINNNNNYNKNINNNNKNYNNDNINNNNNKNNNDYKTPTTIITTSSKWTQESAILGYTVNNISAASNVEHITGNVLKRKKRRGGTRRTLS